MANYPEDEVIIIDNGSGQIKAGLGGQDVPTCVFKTSIGYPTGAANVGHKQFDYVCGDDLTKHLGTVNIVNPIEHGKVTDWDSMEKIWHYTMIEKLRIDPRGHCVVLTEAANNPDENRDKMAEIMFEKFEVSHLHIAIQGVCALYQSGSMTGTVLDIGDGVAHTIPVVDGVVMNGVRRVQLAGRDLTNYLSTTLLELGITMDTPTDLVEVAKMKEACCYVASDFNAEMARPRAEISKTYTLPNGQNIELGNQRFRVPEELFNPIHIGTGQMKSIQQLLVSGIVEGCPVVNHNALFGRIVLSGGTTMFPGFKERLQKEVQALTTSPVDVLAAPERMYMVWLGAAQLTAFNNFENLLITAEDYANYGGYSAAVAAKKAGQ